jgi:hypothetical protein
MSRKSYLAVLVEPANVARLESLASVLRCLGAFYSIKPLDPVNNGSRTEPVDQQISKSPPTPWYCGNVEMC